MKTQVLIVDDEPLARERLRQLVEAEPGLELAGICTNGREAVDAVRKAKPDLIFLDVQMPELDGLQATTAIRQIEAESGRHIPILAMTAHALTGDRERCLAAGMDGYLSKPIRLTDLVQAVQNLELNP